MTMQQMTTQTWRNPLFTLTALASLVVSLFASLTPLPAWSCPTTGRVGTADFVCQGMTIKCAGIKGSCCRRITLPAGTFLPVEHKAPTAVAALLDTGTSKVPQMVVASTSAVLPSAFYVPEPQQVGISYASEVIAPPSRHGPSPFSCRAPPVGYPTSTA
jgi:hypothetical protein